MMLQGETSMWQDRYVGSCLFPNAQDRNFTVRRTIIAGIWVAFFQECQQ